MISERDYKEVTLEQMLDAREARAYRQKELLEQYGKPLVCFTMNIAGPVKNSDLIRRGFFVGVEDFQLQLLRNKVPLVYKEICSEVTGNEAFFVVDGDGVFVKRLTCELEDLDEMGRLYDMDVILPSDVENPELHKLDRKEIGLSERTCLICGAPAKVCSSRRQHSVSELQKKTKKILTRTLQERYASRIAELAVRSLLYEVAVTPKPGLVDRFNNGSHKDMDFYTFLNSAAALWPYFKECAYWGFTNNSYAGDVDFQMLFQKLRESGKIAENHMLRATNGVNTHKGAIFSMGILCAAIGTVQLEDWKNSKEVLNVCRKMTKGLVKADFLNLTKENAVTVGQKLYLEYGITGVRGEMEEGLPVVLEYGLPLLEHLLLEGKSADEAGAAALLGIMAHMTDTNLIARSNVSTQKEVSKSAEKMLEESDCPSQEILNAMDEAFIRKNLSPGGSADLLAVCWMLHFIKEF